MPESLRIPDNDPLATQTDIHRLYQATHRMMIKREVSVQDMPSVYSDDLAATYTEAMLPDEIYRYAPEAGAALARLGIGAHYNELCIGLTLQEWAEVELDLAEQGAIGCPEGTSFRYLVQSADAIFKSWFNPSEEEAKTLDLEYDDHEIRIDRTNKLYMASYAVAREDDGRESYFAVDYPLTETRCHLLTTVVNVLSEHPEVPACESEW